jgi:hypothetical protein
MLGGEYKGRSGRLTVPNENSSHTERVAALIAWMLFVRVDDLVKGGAKAPPPSAVKDP